MVDQTSLTTAISDLSAFANRPVNMNARLVGESLTLSLEQDSITKDVYINHQRVITLTLEEGMIKSMYLNTWNNNYHAKQHARECVMNLIVRSNILFQQERVVHATQPCWKEQHGQYRQNRCIWVISSSLSVKVRGTVMWCLRWVVVVG